MYYTVRAMCTGFRIQRQPQKCGRYRFPTDSQRVRRFFADGSFTRHVFSNPKDDYDDENLFWKRTRSRRRVEPW